MREHLQWQEQAIPSTAGSTAASSEEAGTDLEGGVWEMTAASSAAAAAAAGTATAAPARYFSCLLLDGLEGAEQATRVKASSKARFFLPGHASLLQLLQGLAEEGEGGAAA